MNKQTQIEEISTALMNVPRLMHHFRRTFKTDFDVSLKKSEMHLLFALHQHSNLPMKDYLTAVDMESGSFTYLTNNMVEKGLIERVQSEADKRVTVLQLTEKGIETCNQTKRQINSHIQKMICSLGEDDLSELARALYSLENILGKLKENRCE